MGSHPCEKFFQENYNGEDTLHSNCRLSESSMAVEEEEEEEGSFSRNTKFSNAQYPFIVKLDKN